MITQKSASNPNEHSDLPERQGFIDLTPPNLVISSLSLESNNTGTKAVLRFHEQEGSACRAELTLPNHVSTAAKTDFNGRPLDTEAKGLQVSEKKVFVDVQPWEIVTLEIQFR